LTERCPSCGGPLPGRCAVCGDPVRVFRPGFQSHLATHPAVAKAGHCVTCGKGVKMRLGHLGHVWDHPPVLATVPVP